MLPLMPDFMHCSILSMMEILGNYLRSIKHIPLNTHCVISLGTFRSCQTYPRIIRVVHVDGEDKDALQLSKLAARLRNTFVHATNC